MPIERFDADSPFPPVIGRQVSELFANNCIAFDDEAEQDRLLTIEKRSTTEKLNELLESKIFYVAKNVREQVSGVLECDARECGEAMLAFVVWLIVDKQLRGNGISSQLHRRFEQEFVPEVQASTKLFVLQALAVHLKNPAKNIYERWGYEPGEIQYDDGRRLFMTKKPKEPGVREIE